MPPKTITIFFAPFPGIGKKVFMDVTDIVEYNLDVLNLNDLCHSYFQLSREDPVQGFEFDASVTCGHVVPTTSIPPNPRLYDGDSNDQNKPYLRLMLGSHLAQYLRQQLEEQQGYTSTVGVSINKLLSKLVGNTHKPNSQTTLMPPYGDYDLHHDEVATRFLETHDISSIPGLGFKSAEKIRNHVLQRRAESGYRLVYSVSSERLSVKEMRANRNMSPDLLEKILGGPGATKGTGRRIWNLFDGIDESEVTKARDVPHQISITRLQEDSYLRLDDMDEVLKELRMLSQKLIKRMRLDLSCIDSDPKSDLMEACGENSDAHDHASRRWIAHPRIIRLTTRPRPPSNPDGSRSRAFNRISRSCDMPSMVFNFDHSVESLAERLVQETLVPLFRRLHHARSGWNLSLVNICAAAISPVADDIKDSAGRDISTMFRKQADTVTQRHSATASNSPSEKMMRESTNSGDEEIDHDKESESQSYQESSPDGTFDDGIADGCNWCSICGTAIPKFAKDAHERFHALSD
ncbi:MAG: hypothetical protein Q9167_001549 [Letrouitia subvulpina]